jgi:tRNA (guanine-N7-)-methyltransferase
VRKPRKRTADEIAPYVWELPQVLQGRWGDRTKAGTEPEPQCVPIDWPTLFGNRNPVEIEVGFGKGLFLVTSGLQHSDRNYFGIEIIRKYQLYAAGRIADRNLTNVRTCCGDAKLLFQRFVVPGTVSTVHVFFPDPWWKTKHKKRLLFTPEFAELILTVLQPHGRLHFVTDVQDYFEWVSESLRANPRFVLQPPPTENQPQHAMDYLTNFERKFRQEGRPIYRSLYEKK